MPSQTHIATSSLSESEPEYLSDERWLLVQRILASRGFQRAGQLRRILEYITRAALLNPTVVLREYEIACEALGRRANFDPTNDNIVRSQMSQLRRRLETYFTEEAPEERLRITIAKGAYLPQFHEAPIPSLPRASISSAGSSPAGSIASLPVSASPVADRPSGWRISTSTAIVFLAMVLMLCTLVASLLYREQHPGVAVPEPNKANAFVQFLRNKGTDVTIVLPDVSLMLMQNALNTNVSNQGYKSGAFTDKLAEQRDPVLRKLLISIRERRLTTVNEALIAQDMKDTLGRNGVNAKVHFARDMQTRDFGEGNFILIGSVRSNPWTDLFSSQTNFPFNEDATHNYVYRNIVPAPGEQATYPPYQKREGNKLTSYADVAFTANLTHSGYVVLINGSDFAANEAAERYLMHGMLRQDLTVLLKHKELSYVEVLFGGTHGDHDAEEKFEPVAIRPLRPIP